MALWIPRADAPAQPPVRLVLPAHVTRLVVLGDPHGDLDGVARVVAHEDDGRTLPVCVGDVVGYADGPTSSALCAWLAERHIPTVQGNHEDWALPTGTLAILATRHAPRQLTDAAHSWIDALPHALDLRDARDQPVALVVHSIREPAWDWIDLHNVAAYAGVLGRPRLILAGHSHRPKLLHVDGHVTRTAFDFRRDASVEGYLPTEGTLVLDAGSVGRPSAYESGAEADGDEWRHWIVYGVVDLTRRTVSLRRLPR